ncbi:prepilin-type N-terminal cleavage/methylation domain-containing protein [Amphritea sp.]|uniref:GspH/FimT family pseudopilin n=1 Tax=Amphritea sp. TaxID=1872502 RepID=UPI0025C1A541|nr:prepilin-type N-terminal cleavage/methylation domain-containing protein [Amphritea sp.]
MAQQSAHLQQQTGFTLLELLVVMAIAGMLLALIVPRFSAAFAGARFQQQAQTLNTTLKQARYSAVKTGEILRLELSNTGNSLLNAEGDVIFSWPDDTELIFIDQKEELVSNGYVLFIPGAGSNGATLRLTQREKGLRRQATFQVSWLTGGVSYETL